MGVTAEGGVDINGRIGMPGLGVPRVAAPAFGSDLISLPSVNAYVIIMIQKIIAPMTNHSSIRGSLTDHRTLHATPGASFP